MISFEESVLAALAHPKQSSMKMPPIPGACVCVSGHLALSLILSALVQPVCV